MANNITVVECCAHYEIEVQFVKSLQAYGLIEIVEINNEEYLHFEQLSLLEKYIRFHYEFEINMEGLDAVRHLLHQIEELQSQLKQLRNKG